MSEGVPEERSLVDFLKSSYSIALAVTLSLIAVFLLRIVTWGVFARDRAVSEGIARDAIALIRAGRELSSSPQAPISLAASPRRPWSEVLDDLSAIASRAGRRSGFTSEELARLEAAILRLRRLGPGGADYRDAGEIVRIALDANERRESFFVTVGLVGILAMSLALSVLISSFLVRSRRKIRRIETAIAGIAAQTEALAAGDFEAQPIGGGDEPGQISAAIASASRRLKLAHEELAAERDRSAALLAERERLFRELAHRVKNNYAVMASLVELQRREAPEGEAGEALAVMGGRIRSIALLHDHLDPIRGGGDSIALRPFLSELLGGLVAALSAGPEEVELRLDGCSASLDYRRAKTVGLVVNELATNSLKHALPAARAEGRRLELRVGLRESGDRCLLELADDGPGYPAAALERLGPGGEERRLGAEHLGLELVRRFCQDLGGEARFSNAGGASFSVDFPRAAPPR